MDQIDNNLKRIRSALFPDASAFDFESVRGTTARDAEPKGLGEDHQPASDAYLIAPARQQTLDPDKGVRTGAPRHEGKEKGVEPDPQPALTLKSSGPVLDDYLITHPRNETHTELERVKMKARDDALSQPVRDKTVSSKPMSVFARIKRALGL